MTNTPLSDNDISNLAKYVIDDIDHGAVSKNTNDIKEHIGLCLENLPELDCSSPEELEDILNSVFKVVQTSLSK